MTPSKSGLSPHDRPPPEASERSFGLTFAAVFALIGLWPLIWGNAPRAWSLAIAAVFLILSYAWPAILKSPKRAWLRFGEFLHHVTNPIVLGLMFYVVLTPIAFVTRLFGRDHLRLKRDTNAPSYWIKRTDPPATADTLRNQF